MKVNISLKNIMRVLAFITIIVFFCPTFLVSCDDMGYSKEISAVDICSGKLGEENRIIVFSIMIMFILVPMLGFFALFGKQKKESSVTNKLIIISIINILMWVGLRKCIVDYAQEQECIAETTFWYNLNFMALCSLIILSVLTKTTKLRLSTCFVVIDLEKKMIYKNSNEANDDEVEGIKEDVKDTKEDSKSEVIDEGEINARKTNDALNNLKGISISFDMTKIKTKVSKIKALPRKKLIIILSAALALLGLVVGGVIFAIENSKINLDDYVSYKIVGYDGYGELEMSLDIDKLMDVCGKKIKVKEDIVGEELMMFKLMSKEELFDETVSIVPNKDENLKNGETVTYKWKIDKSFYRIFDTKLKYSNGKVEIRNLKKISTFDAFKRLKVSFSGISTDGKIDIEYEGEDFTKYDFNVSKDSKLKNGDKVKISLEEKDIEYYIARGEKVPSEMTKTYVVEGLAEYIEKTEEITNEYLEKIKKEAEDKVYSYTANAYSSWKVSGLKYAGYIMKYLSESESDYYDEDNNKLYIVYSGLFSDDGDYSNEIIYYPVEFSNLMKAGEEIKHDEDIVIAGKTEVGGWSYTDGYFNIFECLDEITGDEKCESFTLGDDLEKYDDYKAVTGLTDINDEFKKQQLADAKKVIADYIKNDYSSTSKIKNFKYVGEYFLNRKEQENLEKQSEVNRYVVVCAAIVYSTENNFKPTVVFYPVIYEGVFKLKNGDCKSYYGGYIEGQSDLLEYYYRTKGYVSGEEMYKDIVTANRDKYNYEVSTSLQKYGK